MNEVFGLQFAVEGLADLAAKIISERVPAGTGPRLLVTANVDHIVNLRKHAEFRAAYASAWMRTADGFPVYLYARMRGVPVHARVTGSDLFADIFRSLDPEAHRVFFIACTEETGKGLKESLLRRGFPEDSVDFRIPMHGFETDEGYSSRLAEQVRGHRTTHLFMGLGAPKSEIWCYQHRPSLGDCYVLSVGAGLSFFLGHKRRAPKVLQKIGMEWLWRFGQEPRRLFRRYFISSWGFVSAIVEDLEGKSEISSTNLHANLPHAQTAKTP